MRYHTFSLSLVSFEAISNALPHVTVKFIKKIYNKFLKMVATRGNTLQIVQNQANLRENIRLCVW